MTLSDIEQAIKGQFIFQKARRGPKETEYEFLQRSKTLHRLHCDKEREKIKSLAIIIFIGIADQYNIDEESTLSHLQIDYRMYQYYKQFYDRYLTEANELRQMGKKLTGQVAKFYTKLGLCRNYISNNFRK